MSAPDSLKSVRIFDIVTLPAIAWPTLALTACGVAAHATAAYMHASAAVSTPAAFALATLAIFLLFTPMHDAAHGSVATASSGWVRVSRFHNYRRLPNVTFSSELYGRFSRWQGALNTVVGWVCACAFPMPYTAFRYLHLQHHAHTNETDGRDPDEWTARGPWWQLPFRWATIELRYYSLYLPLLVSRTAPRPPREVVATLAQLAAQIAAIAWLWPAHAHTVWYAWLLPGRVALALLAYSFDYLPHRPHTATRAQDPIAATCVTSLVGRCTWPLTWPLLQQNYHNIHHLWPFLPFYCYERVWTATQHQLLALGTAVIPVFGGGGGGGGGVAASKHAD